MLENKELAQLPSLGSLSPGDDLMSGAAPMGKALDTTAKAAIVVRILLNEGADLPLEDLPEELQARLTERMGRMGLVR